MPTDPNIYVDILDRILKFTSTYGMSVVFTTAILLLLLWFTVTAINLLKKWVPIWFAWNIRSYQKTCEHLDRSTEMLSCIHENTHAVGAALVHFGEAARHMVNKNPDKIRDSRNVIPHIDNGIEALSEADRNKRRREQHRQDREQQRIWEREQLEGELSDGKPTQPTDSELQPDEYETRAAYARSSTTTPAPHIHDW